MPDQFTLLLEWRRNEAAVRGLAKLPHDFYSTTQAYLAELRRSYEADLRENPSGRKGEIARQTYQRASQAARDIVEGRVQKVLTAAFQASIGGARELPNALAEEKSIFDEVLSSLLGHRRAVAPYLEPAGPSAAPAPSRAASPPPASSPSAPPPVRAAAPPPSSGPVSALEYVRILKGGRPIEVGSETLDLKEDDIVSLPPEAAQRLIRAQMAEPVATSAVKPST